MPPLIQIEDHDEQLVHRSRQLSKAQHGPRIDTDIIRSTKIREHTRILMLEELEQSLDQSSGARELLGYADELRILKNPALSHYYVHLPWQVKSIPVSQLIVSDDLHQTHSGNYEWIGEETNPNPKYLWDSQDGCTVRATPKILEDGYIAVSWTWGRYQQRSHDVPLERYSRGVGPSGRRWKVPQLPNGPNGKDLLHDLKVCLKSIDAHRYFWVDLLCIDQHNPYEMRMEIAKQASIFGKAKATLCYLWHQTKPEDLTEAMKGLGRLLNWALVFGDGKVLADPETGPIEHEFPLGSARHEEQAYHSRFGHLKDDHWFTSLWALQEIVLAPAGVWMTRYGDMCKINGQILTTRLMAIIIRLLSWAAFQREELWEQVCVVSIRN